MEPSFGINRIMRYEKDILQIYRVTFSTFYTNVLRLGNRSRIRQC